jgi:Fibronectin type III domain
MFTRTLAAALCVVFLQCATATTAVAGTQSVTVIWDPNSEQDVVGYRLFYGTESRVYTNHIDVPGPMAVASDLLEGETYYFAAIAYNIDGEESPLSTEISYNVPVGSPSPSPTPENPIGGLVNVSTRDRVTSGEDVLIGGFIITGDTPCTVVLRGIGPSLTRSGVEHAARDPMLTLFDSTGAVLASNDDWDEQDPVNIATGLMPTDPLESMVVATLPAGAYTVVLETKGSPGVALFELYELGNDLASGVVNLSTRGRVGLGDDVMIAGFILTGDYSTQVIVRAIGPSLSDAGISQPLADPELELYDGNGSLIFQNDNWRSDQEMQIVASGMAPSAEQESAIMVTLPAGNYTALVRGVGGSEGVALVELYTLE